MPSRLTRRRQAAARRDVHAFRAFDPTDYRETARLPHWDVFVGSEWMLGPRELKLTKREAIAFAYQIAVSKRFKLRAE